jgi:hypothetical protein
MRVRVPAILDQVLEHNGDYPDPVRLRLAQLQEALRSNHPLPALDETAPYASDWLAGLAERGGQSWLGTDWFFAENYLYRQLVEAADFWRARRDPFAPIKREEYASSAHRNALDAAAQISGAPEQGLELLLAAAVFGNRIDLSFAASLERGTSAEREDLLLDDRAAAVQLLTQTAGPVHVVVDNAGTELSVDLVLVSRILEWLDAPVTLHVKVHPTFVSDATTADLQWFLDSAVDGSAALWRAASEAARQCREQLARALQQGRLQILPHAFWNGHRSLWELPSDLERQLTSARLVILKGDAHYRRAVGDALWPPDTSFSEVTSYFPAPVLALRTLKSDAIVGVPTNRAAELDHSDARWRVNGQRAVASLGGATRPNAAQKLGETAD